ncbi:MAG: sigma 54-interacting transcriptional regulator [Pseudomonadales bacterium]|nr:sigma 54-interacting transcriptional regulator [Pseudomonadales bacterium]
MQENPNQIDCQNTSGIKDIMGECDAIKTICHQIRQIAPTPCTVLVSGETGTGKSLFAKRIFELSDRTEKPFIYMNCATPPETTIEAEIFGYQKKTLTGRSDLNLENLIQLNGGTLLIDEISELPSEGQANFLEVLEFIEKHNRTPELSPIDIRLIVTTQNDLRQLLHQNRFNKRLFYHLNVFSIEIPPLRDRGSDKIKIAETLLQQACIKYKKSIAGFAPDAIKAINQYQWPGNYRELSNIVERAVVMTQNDMISADLMLLDKEPSLQFESNQEKSNKSPELAEATKPGSSQDLSLEDYFQHFVLEHQDLMTETELAQKLGISRKCLWERRQKLGIPKRKSATRPE